MEAPKPREYIFTFTAVLLITLVYLGMNFILGGVPAASSFYGHSMGVVGFLLMLMAETLYSLRKRSRFAARWGQMSTWLELHIFTGTVGPYLVLLHSAWRFHGVAGVLMLMTGVVVVSGFIGRYICTSVPRTADEIVVETEEVQRQIARLEAAVQAWVSERAGLSPALVRSAEGRGSGRLSPPGGTGWGQRGMDRELKSLLRRREALRWKMGSLQIARKLLATWHVIHISIGLGLFGLAFVHIAAAVYYATLLR